MPSSGLGHFHDFGGSDYNPTTPFIDAYTEKYSKEQVPSPTTLDAANIACSRLFCGNDGAAVRKLCPLAGHYIGTQVQLP